jgi:6-phosphogluconate dehydrogenase
MGAIFSEWNSRRARFSFLIEITADILKQKDPKTKKKAFVDVVLDTAGQKGTGKWTSTNALDMGVPAPTIAEAVFARCISALKDERVAASKILKGPGKKYKGSKKALIQLPFTTRSTARRSARTRRASSSCAPRRQEYGWKLNFGEIAQIFRGGCIIRAAFLQKITEAYARTRTSPTCSSIRISTRR